MDGRDKPGHDDQGWKGRSSSLPHRLYGDLPLKPDSNISPEVVKEHGLTPEEFERAVAIMGRTPNLTELGIFSVMWSEHCSYKSSRKWLRRLPTTGPRVI